jgi:hypothetical protein
MNAISKLTASWESCQKLVTVGIEPRAFFWHTRDEHEQSTPEKPRFVWDVWEFEGVVNYKYGQIVPAWTMEELEVMMGPYMPKPVMPTKDLRDTYTNPYEWIYFDSLHLYNWTKGSQAAADMLLEGLKQNLVTVAQANERYTNFYLKP